MPQFTYSATPDESRPSLAPYLVQPQTPELTEADFTRDLEQVKRQHRGVKLAIAQAEHEKTATFSRASGSKLGIAAIHVESTKQDFYAAGFKLIEKRASAASAQDNAAFAVSAWGYNQDSIKQKIQGLHLQVQEASQKNLDKSDDLKLRGVIPQFTRRL
jgi:hypothetical protein